MVLRLGGDSDQGGENCLKWNGISSLLKIGGRMLRYVFYPIFINEKMRKKWLNINEKMMEKQFNVKLESVEFQK